MHAAHNGPRQRHIEAILMPSTRLILGGKELPCIMHFSVCAIGRSFNTPSITRSAIRFARGIGDVIACFSSVCFDRQPR